MSSYNTCCPQPVAVTINEITSEAGLIKPSISYSQGLVDTAGRVLVQAQIDGVDISGRYKVVIWFEDTNGFTGYVSPDYPTTPGASVIEFTTDSNGKVVDGDALDGMAVQYSGTAKTWYAYARIGGVICDTPATVQIGA